MSSQLPSASATAPRRGRLCTRERVAPLEPVVPPCCDTFPLLPVPEDEFPEELLLLPAIDAGGEGKGNDLLVFDSRYMFAVGMRLHFPMASSCIA
jgi:hypothetical protein